MSKKKKENWLIKYYCSRWNKYYDWVIKYFKCKTPEERIKLIKEEGLYLPGGCDDIYKYR